MKLLKTICYLSLALSLNACAVRTIYIASGNPVQLAEPVKAKVWVPDKDGIKVKSTMTIPEGWYAVEDQRK